jgi:hypothetical protein
MEEEELLECNARQLTCEPVPPPRPAPAAVRADPHLDEAAGDLVADRPVGWGVLLDPDEAGAGVLLDPDAAAPAPGPAPSGPSIGPATGPYGPGPRLSLPLSERDAFRREIARRDASPDAFDWRAGEDGPYIYGEHREGTGFHPGGTTFGFGVAHNPEEDGGGDLINAHFGAGQWRDQDGGEYEGIRLNGGFLSGTTRGDTLDRGEIGIGTFDFGAYSTDETFTAGAQANFGEIAGRFGNEEHNLRLGASAGGGLGFRLHYGDEDGDGVRERGFGADLGWASFDVRSEHIGRAWDWAFGD